MVKNDEIVGFGEIFDRRELETAERTTMPCDVNIRMALAEDLLRRNQRIDGSPVIPRHALEFDFCQARLPFS
jgi:hypothetical protein